MKNRADLSNFDSYQGTALAVAKTKHRGYVRLLKVSETVNEPEYVVHTNVDPETKEGMNGLYYDNLPSALHDFMENVKAGFGIRQK